MEYKHFIFSIILKLQLSLFHQKSWSAKKACLFVLRSIPKRKLNRMPHQRLQPSRTAPERNRQTLPVPTTQPSPGTFIIMGKNRVQQTSKYYQFQKWIIGLNKNGIKKIIFCFYPASFTQSRDPAVRRLLGESLGLRGKQVVLSNRAGLEPQTSRIR